MCIRDRDNLVDDLIDGSSGDEDDSDLAVVDSTLNQTTGGAVSGGSGGFGSGTVFNVTSNRTTNNTNVPTAQAPRGAQPFANEDLAFTGANSRTLALIGTILLASGAFLVMAGKRRRDTEDGFELDWQQLDD